MKNIIFKLKIRISIVILLTIVSLNVVVNAAPVIIETWNSTTRDDAASYNLNLKELTVFRVKADQDIVTWHWSVNGVEQTLPPQTYGPAHPRDCSFRIWADSDGVTYVIEAYGSNANGNTGAVQWTITVPSRKGNLTGKVTDTNNSALAGVTITDGLYTAVSDSNGNYSINNMTEKTYALTAHKAGYVWLTKLSEVRANQATSTNFQLPLFSPAAISTTTDAIALGAGDTTIGLINQAIQDPSFLEEISPKIWLLKKKIGGTSGNLYINGEDCQELRMVSNNDGNEVKIHPGRQHIYNTNIISWNTNFNAPAPDTDTVRAMIQVEGGTTGVVLVNSSLRYLTLRLLPGTSETFMQNCVMEHTSGYSPDGTYGLRRAMVRDCRVVNGKMGIMTSFSDSICEGNVVSANSGAFSVGGHGKNVSVRNVLSLNAGWSGIGLGDNSGSSIINSVSINAFHNGIDTGGSSGTPLINPTLKNIESFSINDNGYYVTTWDFVTPSVQNAVIEDCVAHEINSRPLCVDPGINTTIRRFKGWNNHSGITILDSVSKGSDSNYIIDSEVEVLDTLNDYSFNFQTTKNNNIINSKANNTAIWIEGSDVTYWYYLDVVVRDINGIPVKDANVSASHPTVSINWFGDGTEYSTVTVKPINLHVIPRQNTEGQLDPQFMASTFSGADGHTPLPSDSDKTLVIAERRRDQHGSPWFQHPAQNTEYSSWTVTAEKYGFSADVKVNPDATWYRPKPGVPTKTITLTLPFDSLVYGSISGTVKDNTDKPIQGATLTTGYNSTSTDINGKYTLQPVPVGTYTLTASCKGFLSQSRQVQVLESQSTGADFTLAADYSSKTPYVYPVPYTKDKHTSLTFSNILAPAKLEIYTVDGTLVYEKEISESSYSFVPEGFSSGVYIYMIKNSKGTSTGKIVIIK